jgi:hypothetical protein
MPRAEKIKRHAKPQQYESGDNQPLLCRVQTGLGLGYSRFHMSWSGRTRRVRRLDLNGRNEPVAPPRNGFDESGITRIIPNSFPDLEYRHSQALVEFDKGILGPKSVPNLFPRNNLSGAFDKQYQESERLFLQAHTDRSARKCAISRVKQVKPETVADFRGRRVIWSRCRHTSGEI